MKKKMLFYVFRSRILIDSLIYYSSITLFSGLTEKEIFLLFSPDLASVTSFSVEENDLIVIATDGLWDNLPDSTILEETKKMTV